MSIGESLRSFLFGIEPKTQKGALTKAPYATNVRASLYEPTQVNRRGARYLRNFADYSEPLRTAINWRKQQISQARWRIVRSDNPKKPPDERIVKQAQQLFRFINPKRESFRTLMEQVVEDLLVLDAGAIEIEKTLGGDVVALWAVDGATIAPDPNWDGRDPNAIRYRQYIDGRVVAELRNDQMLYMQANPSTHRVLGWSPVETLVNIVEAELYGEKYDFNMLRHAAPAGILDIGRGVGPEQVEAFREYYRTEIEGTEQIAIFGGGDPGQGSGITFQKFGYSPAEMQRTEYKTWLINKIAFVFQLDKSIFGLVGDVNRANGKTMSDRTDQGLAALARLRDDYVTREIIWQLDPSGVHAFETMDLVVTDPLAQAKVWQLHMQMGATTPNEVRAAQGIEPFPGSEKDPEHWANLPYPFNQNTAAQPEVDPLEPDPENPAEPEPGDESTESDAAEREGAESIVPFAVAPVTGARRTARTKRSSPISSTRSS